MKTTQKSYIIRDREAGNIITEVPTYEQAKEILSNFEKKDKEEGIYQPEFYEIVQGVQGVQNENNENNSFKFADELWDIVFKYKDGTDEPLDGDEVDRLIEILRLKINLQEGNITNAEYIKELFNNNALVKRFKKRRIMKKIKLIIGDITFLETPNVAIINEIDAIVFCENEVKATQIGEQFIGEYKFGESYLVPSIYSGIIQFKCDKQINL